MKIKIICTVTLLIFFTGCSQPYINFTIEAPKISKGTFTVYDDNGNMVYGANIKNFNVKFEHQYLKQPGYYTFKIVNNDARAYNQPAEIYLEPGDYSIKVDERGYPLIAATSGIQKDLTTYYRAVDSISVARGKSYRHYNKLYENSEVTGAAANAMADTLNQKRLLYDNAKRDALADFVKTHPQSIAAAHMMSEMETDYEQDPKGFYAIFEHLSSKARESDDGKDMGERLTALIALLPGHLAPMIIGTSPDGKPFNTSGLNKKIYLLEFWKAGSTMTRVNHQEEKIALLLSEIKDKNNFGMIGVSLDHKRDWWLAAIKDDKLTWPQYSDLKGNDSDNLTNWQITTLPAYYLLDSKWHIIESNIDMEHLPVNINSYLANH